MFIIDHGRYIADDFKLTYFNINQNIQYQLNSRNHKNVTRVAEYSKNGRKCEKEWFLDPYVN